MQFSVGVLNDEPRVKFWSKEPFRHVQLSLSLRNERDSTVDGVTFEVLVPEEAVFDFSGDRWQPSHKHEVDGIAYDVWEDRGATASITFPRGAVVEMKIGINLLPYVESIAVRWRLFRDGEPIGKFGLQELAV